MPRIGGGHFPAHHPNGEAPMPHNQLASSRHNAIRAVLRVGGPLVAGVGILFMIIGFVSFFSAFGSLETPRYFWCLFIGMPLLFLGTVMCFFGFLGSFYRYVASEAAPVAKDTVNYMGEGTRPGVKAVAKAVTEGILEARNEQQLKQ
jgi:hypothetical protein